MQCSWRLLLLALALPAPILAQENETAGERPAELPEGSLWDFVEPGTGTVPTPESLVASQELAAEHFAAQRYVDIGNVPVEPDPSIYLDPLGLLTQEGVSSDTFDPNDFDIPVVMNAEVEKWMGYFLGRGRDYFSRYLARSGRYLPLEHAILVENGLPRDLIYLSMIESGFSPLARSHASAVGLWQFIAPTGRRYGLRIDYWVDERRDPELATRAAAAYLGDLYEQYGDWYLAWSAYNAGPSRVARASKATGSTDFWVLSSALPAETRNYVPKLLAAAVIGKHPERYGFDVEAMSPLAYDTAEIKGSVTMDVLARCAQTDVAVMERLNPALLRGATPPDGTTSIRLPLGTAERFELALAETPASQRATYNRHRVAKGESMGSIARRYGVSVSAIARFNKITDPNRIYVGMELVIPMLGQLPPHVAEPVTQHTVSRGENLSGIAHRYGVETTQLVAWNDLSDPDALRPGMVLEVRGGKAERRVALTYTVRKGDTLSEIASEHRVETPALMSWNDIEDPRSIQVGQVLQIYTSARGWRSYTVKAGDNLGAIARRHGVSVSDIQGWNSLDSTVIHPGQTLRIRSL
jgi:membrane-bound lytic murein transglycosylase D